MAATAVSSRKLRLNDGCPLLSQIVVDFALADALLLCCFFKRIAAAASSLTETSVRQIILLFHLHLESHTHLHLRQSLKSRGHCLRCLVDGIGYFGTEFMHKFKSS